MKNRVLIFISVIFIFFACTTDESQFLENEKTAVLQNSQNRTNDVLATFSDSPDIQTTSLNEIIVKYKLGISEDAKEIIREDSGVVSFRTCDCTNGGQRYELWIMEDGIDIEPTVKVIKGKTKDEVDFVAPNRGYNIPMYAITSESQSSSSNEVYIESTLNEDYLNRIVPSNSGVTIAVLDTGIDTDQVGFSGRFLYNSSQNANCNEDSGWDFVNGDGNTYDDDPNKHGTIISYVIHNELIQKNINYQILPVKTADAKGNSTFFNTLCGLKYAIEKDSDVINMSFGWESSDQNVYDIFSDLISTTSAILVTSAGNKSKDNDVTNHYPSNFSQDHVLAVAAAKYDLSGATSYSNYGVTTVDFYAVGNQIAFPLRIPNAFVNVRGTSFSTPKVTARVAELLSNNFQSIRTGLVQEFGVSVNYFNKPVFYMKLIE